jgi:E3 ubiquitin-protein ligase DOA10
MNCRVCDDIVNEQKKYCKCNQLIHIECLTKWIDVSKRLNCEICKSIFEIPEMYIQPITNEMYVIILFLMLKYFVNNISLFFPCLLLLFTLL